MPKKGEPLSEEHKAKMKAGRASKVTEKESLASLSERVDKLVDIVDRLVQMRGGTEIFTIPAPVNTVNPPSPIINVSMPQSQDNTAGDLKYSVPVEWRKKVDEYLGVDFVGEVSPTSNGNFSLKILFPKHIDRRVGISDAERAKPDCSMAAPILRATDVADVEKWCKLIQANIKKTYPDFKPNQL